jgi:hypothetical protein
MVHMQYGKTAVAVAKASRTLDHDGPEHQDCNREEFAGSDELRLAQSLAQPAPLALAQSCNSLAHELLAAAGALELREFVHVDRSETMLQLLPADPLDRFHTCRHPNSWGLVRGCDSGQALAQQQLDRGDPRTDIRDRSLDAGALAAALALDRDPDGPHC